MAITYSYQDTTIYDAQGHTGNIYYVRLVDKLTGLIWDNTNEEMATTPTRANSAVALPELGTTGQYPFNVPAKLPAGNYDMIVYKRAGASPANSDNIENQYDLRKGSIFGF